jgi:hypothetical protein
MQQHSISGQDTDSVYCSDERNRRPSYHSKWRRIGADARRHFEQKVNSDGTACRARMVENPGARVERHDTIGDAMMPGMKYMYMYLNAKHVAIEKGRRQEGTEIMNAKSADFLR